MGEKKCKLSIQYLLFGDLHDQNKKDRVYVWFASEPLIMLHMQIGSYYLRGVRPNPFRKDAVPLTPNAGACRPNLLSALQH